MDPAEQSRRPPVPPPSPEASAALVLVEVLRDQIEVLQEELVGARRLAITAFGVASAAIGGLVTVSL